jgi:uncharacterized phosphosugar-binding protein
MEGEKFVPVSAKEFFAVASDAMARVESTQLDAITRAAALLAERMRSGGVVQVFGTGHSRAFAMELAGRAGGLVPVHGMHLTALAMTGRYTAAEVAEPSFERHPGITRELAGLYDIRPEDAFIVVSNSGRNGSIVEMALLATERKMPVVVVTSMAHTSEVASRHPSGKRLFEVADVVIDNCAPFGDAVLDMGQGTKICAVSSITGAIIAQALTAEIAACYQRRGEQPPVLVSANIDGADDHNAQVRARYGSRISWDV